MSQECSNILWQLQQLMLFLVLTCQQSLASGSSFYRSYFTKQACTCRIWKSLNCGKMMGLCLQLIDDDLFDFCCNFNVVNVKLIASNIDIRKISVLEVAFGYVVEGCHFLCHCFDFQIILLLSKLFLILVFILQAFVVHCKVETASCEQMYPEPQRPGKSFFCLKKKVGWICLNTFRRLDMEYIPLWLQNLWLSTWLDNTV